MCIHTKYLKRKVLLGLATSLLALTLGGPAAKAQLAVDNLVVDFVNPLKSRQDIVLANTGKENAYVQVTVTEVLLGDDGKKTTRTGSPEQLGLLVTPTKLILGPGQRRPIRAILLQHPSFERIYHISVTPVSGDIIGDKDASTGGKIVNIQVLVGYTISVFVRPPQIVEDLQSSKVGKAIRFENKGNVSVLLQEGRQCPKAASTVANCKDLPLERIWPGKVWELALPLEGPVTYTIDGPLTRVQRVF